MMTSEVSRVADVRDFLEMFAALGNEMNHVNLCAALSKLAEFRKNGRDVSCAETADLRQALQQVTSWNAKLALALALLLYCRHIQSLRIEIYVN